LYLVEGKAIKHYAEKFNVPLSSLNKKLDKYFKLRKK
jgi:hypothetical protein